MAEFPEIPLGRGKVFIPIGDGTEMMDTLYPIFRLREEGYEPVVSGPEAEARVGNGLPISSIPLGTTIHNIELIPGKGGQIVRSAGAAAQLLAKEGDWATIRLPSGEMRRLSIRCMATVGAVSNPDNMNITIGKAGRQRWKGRMPHNRGITMNPVDHPHGGRTKGGGHPVTPWGFPTKGKKTRKNKTSGKFIMLSRHARKKTS